MEAPSIKVRKVESFWSKISLSDVTWSNLKAPNTETPVSHSHTTRVEVRQVDAIVKPPKQLKFVNKLEAEITTIAVDFENTVLN